MIIVASRPLTTSDNLLFEPLNELLAYAKRKPSQLLVLLGPFVDSEHPEIKKGTVDATFDEIFQVEVLTKPRFDIHIPDLEHQLTSLSNPGTFEANQVKVGCCTVDVLKHLSGEEMSKNPSGVPIDRMSRLASHLLRQRSFYPLYPPPESLPYDSSLAPKALQISSIPDILLLPSDMRKLPRLEYRETDVKSKSVWWFLDESMRLHNLSSLQKLCIKLGPRCPVDVDVVEWVAKAVDGSVLHKLKFRLLWESEPVTMPNSLYTCKTLTKLTLSYKILVDVPCLVYLPSLNRLDLQYVVYKDEDSHVRLLSGCPVLKYLDVLRDDDDDDHVMKFTVKVPSLLELTYATGVLSQRDGNDRSLVIDTPSLTYLDIFDYSGHSCSIEYMPRLTRAWMNASIHPGEKFLKSLSTIKYLTLTRLHTLVPWCNVVFSLLEECSLCPFRAGWCESLGVLLSNCPKLKVLMVDSTCEDHASVLWNQPRSVSECLSSHLEIFRWQGYAGRKYQKKVIRYILKNSKCLKKAEISLKSIGKLEEEQKKKMIEKLQSMYRVSTSILLAGPRF
ncbi:unnamed protein product [Thlaspi arvense]|uniref:DNA polymerase alpha subunit B n=1 Tax=Thlaspi arvense TaxID=13288 RepID=A0AAU9SH03_THLAR|nr:unnamed protein product [Thlaspi arvense]